MRIGVASIALEANTFNPLPTELEHFRAGVFLRGNEIWQLESAHHELGGFLAGLKQEQIEVVPLLVAAAAPGGTIPVATFDTLRGMLQEELRKAGPLEGVLLAPHGAMVAENAADADGCWLKEVRDWCGPDVPIVATIDPHANVSPQMVAQTDALIAYKTNPHIDQRTRGLEAAALIARAARGEVRLHQAACFPPIAIEIERQYSSSGTCAELLEKSRQLQNQPGVLSSSIILGFPYADVAEMGSAAIVVTDGNIASPEPYAQQLGQEIWDRRLHLKSHLTAPPDAVRQAAEFEGTTCLLDMGDNVGGGSPGDCTGLFHELQAQRVGPALGVLIDPDAARQAHSIGTGATATFQLGGQLPGTAGAPLYGSFRVTALSDGRFSEDQPRHGGQQHFDQGLSAVLEKDGLTVIAISKRVPPFSLRQVTHLGVDPGRFRVLVAKGVHAPVAAYAPVCSKFIRVNTPGITAADMRQFTYDHRRCPLFPLEMETDWEKEIAFA